MRDAVALPKEDRARLHQALAYWIEEATGDRVSEYEGIVGYHLEQAVKLRAELAPVTDDDRAVGRRAARWLGAAGRRALEQDDVGVAAGLLDRASNLLAPDDVERLELLLALGDALVGSGQLARAEVALTEALDRASAAGEDRHRAHGTVAMAILARSIPPDEPFAEAVRNAIDVFTAAGDLVGAERARRLLAELGA